LRKDPAHRYVSAAALGDDLRRFVAGEPIVARPVSWLERTWKWARRHPAVVALSTALVVAVVLGFVLVTWRWREELAARATAQFKEQEAEAARAQEESAKKLAIAAHLQAKENETKATAARLDAERQRDEVRRNLYIADLRLALQAWQDTQLSRLEELLAGQHPERTGQLDLRNFEWYYLKQRLKAYHLALPGHGSVAFSADGKRVAALSGTSVKVWETTTGKKLLVLEGYPLHATQVAWSPDGKTLATAFDD
jgi:hypothetical protein